MRFGSIILASLVGGLIVLLGVYLWQPSMQGATAGKTQSAFERVIQSKTLRCGYVIIEPGLVKDPTTGQLSGLVYDLVMEIGKTLDLKIEWTEETTFATEVEGLRARRYDMTCTTIFWRPNLMQHIEFIQPYYYIPVYVVQRKGETRFKTVSDINRPDITIAGIDGTIPSLIAQQDFTKAKMYSLPNMTAYSENVLSVVTRKADVTFVDPFVFYGYAKNNPGQVEINPSIPPLRLFANTFVVLKGEHELRTMVSAAVRFLLDNGKVEEIIRKYEPTPGSLMRISQPYVSAK
ncbi:MAG: transporter substrate-binding domain-containing protein [Alphaproteobacteria bacterium]|nr:transporter substrate-binding domain-containing protein [Alphaproteobacteria bacterium]